MAGFILFIPLAYTHVNGAQISGFCCLEIVSYICSFAILHVTLFLKEEDSTNYVGDFVFRMFICLYLILHLFTTLVIDRQSASHGDIG